MKLDSRGIPITGAGELYSPEAPPTPCELCTGNSAVTDTTGYLLTSWEWCERMNTCAATVDWEKIYGQG
jgi:hypothetical protein